MSLDDLTSQFGYTADSVLTRKAQNIKMAEEIAIKYNIKGGWKELFNPYVVNASANFADLLEPLPINPKSNDTQSD